ncbi:hypothetical protein ACFV9C_11655 [Kribbella sp. NPDC059898]|uniref:hypothetical protein n=1 Tax=Kribbella sp. NPDC059898 TaxID=3346995 RepID=UPI003649CD05
MLLAGLLTAGVVALMMAMGFVVDQLLGADADRWAGRVLRDCSPGGVEEPTDVHSVTIRPAPTASGTGSTPRRTGVPGSSGVRRRTRPGVCR